MNGRRVIESVSRTEIEGARVVRVWREFASLEDAYQDRETIWAIREVAHMPTLELAQLLAALPRVSAVEVSEPGHPAVCIYPDWP